CAPGDLQRLLGATRVRAGRAGRRRPGLASGRGNEPHVAGGRGVLLGCGAGGRRHQLRRCGAIRRRARGAPIAGRVIVEEDEVTSAERKRMEDAAHPENGWREASPWYAWGPYLAERAWGGVREDY